MLYSIPQDAVGPGVFLLFGLVAFLVFSVVVFTLEAVVLWLLQWGTFGRSLLASFLMNLASTIVGILGVGLFVLGLDKIVYVYIIALVLSILFEGGVLMLMKRDAARENWRAAIVANLVSYGLLGMYLLFQRL